MYCPTASSTNPQKRPQRRRSAKHRHQQRELATKTLANRFVAFNNKMPSKFTPKLFTQSTSPTPEWTPLKASKHSQNTVNPIRRVTDCMSVAPNPEKEPIRLNLGDPTVTGCLPPSKETMAAIRDALDSHKFDGYGPATGIPAAREAIVKVDTFLPVFWPFSLYFQHFSRPEAPFTADDVVLASGCSHALEMAIVAIADPGHNILVPQPGFPLYTTLCTPNGIETRQYRLRMEEDGLVDLAHLEAQIDGKTRAIIVNNPSNPTGVVFPKEHLEQILRLAQKHKVKKPFKLS
jgi:tyrosine aminotransferase